MYDPACKEIGLIKRCCARACQCSSGSSPCDVSTQADYRVNTEQQDLAVRSPSSVVPSSRAGRGHISPFARLGCVHPALTSRLPAGAHMRPCRATSPPGLPHRCGTDFGASCGCGGGDGDGRRSSAALSRHPILLLSLLSLAHPVEPSSNRSLAAGTTLVFEFRFYTPLFRLPRGTESVLRGTNLQSFPTSKTKSRPNLVRRRAVLT